MAVTWQTYPVLLVLGGLLALHVCAVYGSYEHTCTLSTRSRGAHRNGICGDNLARIVSLLCSPRGYVSNWFNKRSAPNRPDDSSVEHNLRGILLNKKEALSYLHKRVPRGTRGRSYGSQGITCECCYNRCTYYELLQYCN
uniref:Insulin-like 2A n=1 Tax=Charonia tritonis TaxID=1960912 RepID=A0A1S6JQ30_9CAEN|nr:insulin-like 2A precursor [Charonia tritonis]